MGRQGEAVRACPELRFAVRFGSVHGSVRDGSIVNCSSPAEWIIRLIARGRFG